MLEDELEGAPAFAIRYQSWAGQSPRLRGVRAGLPRQSWSKLPGRELVRCRDRVDAICSTDRHTKQIDAPVMARENMMSATVRKIRQAPAPGEPRVTAPRERKQRFEWTIESVFMPHLATRPKHQRRCTSCGYHGPMQQWFRHFVAPWLYLLALTLVSVIPGLMVLFVPRVTEWIWFYAQPPIVGGVLLAVALLPVGAFLARFARSYKCPHCNSVAQNH